jgi:hypothetical protein
MDKILKTAALLKFWICLLLLAILLGFLSLLLPIVIWRLDLPIVAFIQKQDEQLFELFGLSAFIASTIIAYLAFKKLKPTSLKQSLPIILPLLVSLNLLLIITNFPLRKGDYLVYEDGAEAILNGQNPYALPKPYIYPPLLAQVMAWLYQLINHYSGLPASKSDDLWAVVFYIYQSSQFFLIVLAYFLSYYLARKLRLKRLPSLFLVSALFLFNNPLILTIKWNQLNLWLLDSFLLAIVLVQRFPFISGAAIALGGHLKLYPFIMLLPWIIAKQWRAIAGTIIGFVAILLVQTNWTTDWGLWRQCLTFFTSGFTAANRRPNQFRNTSIEAILHNIFKLANLPSGKVKILASLLIISIIIWLAFRLIKRESYYRQLLKATADSGLSRQWIDIFRLYGHSMEAIALSLLISPSVWSHHYILAMPIAIWGFAICRKDRLWQVSLAIFLIFCPPTFDVFIFSYHGIIGLFLLLYLTAPRAVYDYFRLRQID